MGKIQELTVKHVLNIETGDSDDSEALLPSRAKAFELRREIERDIQRGTPKIVCLACRSEYLVHTTMGQL